MKILVLVFWFGFAEQGVINSQPPAFLAGVLDLVYHLCACVSGVGNCFVTELACKWNIFFYRMAQMAPSTGQTTASRAFIGFYILRH
ncbi:MAG: hypothetical protein V3T96_04190 [Thermodesulfobacteriota bacterium]